MRSHAANSPEAAGRILALLLLADGAVCASKLSVLNRIGAAQQLGLPAGGFEVLLGQLSEDLNLGARPRSCPLDALDGPTLRALMGEVSDARLRSEVLTLAQAAAHANEHLAEGEAFLLAAACCYWSLSPAELQPPAVPV